MSAFAESFAALVAGDETANTTPADGLPTGVYPSDPQGHTVLVGVNGRRLTVLDVGSPVRVGGVDVEDPDVLAEFAARLSALAGRLRARKDGTR